MLRKEALRVLNSKEKENVELQLEWTSVKHLGKVALYQECWSPPCCKLRMIFEFENHQGGLLYQC